MDDRAFAALPLVAQMMCRRMHQQLLDEWSRPGEMHPRFSILQRFVDMSDEEISRCIDLYEAHCDLVRAPPVAAPPVAPAPHVKQQEQCSPKQNEMQNAEAVAWDSPLWRSQEYTPWDSPPWGVLNRDALAWSNPNPQWSSLAQQWASYEARGQHNSASASSYGEYRSGMETRIQGDERERYDQAERLANSMPSTAFPAQDATLELSRLLPAELDAGYASPMDQEQAQTELQAILPVGPVLADTLLNERQDRAAITTMVLKNLPKKCTVDALVHSLQFHGFLMDFVYQPQDWSTHNSKGYMIINFISEEQAELFRAEYNGRIIRPPELTARTTYKLTVESAAVQGLLDNIEKRKKMIFHAQNAKNLPVVFDGGLPIALTPEVMAQKFGIFSNKGVHAPELPEGHSGSE